MKRMIPVFSSLLASAMLLAACGTQAATSDAALSPTANAVSATATAAVERTSSEEVSALVDPVDAEKETTDSFSITSDQADAVAQTGSIYTITAAGEYTLSGALDGQVVVNAGDEDEIKLILSNAAIACDTDAPILVLNAAEVTIKSESDTYNTVTDARSSDASAAEGSDENYDAAIYAVCDLKLTGSGTLIVTSGYDNGIKSKDDLSVKNVTLKVTSVGNALKGNDSVTIKSGELILISTASDGVKTVNSDVSGKGNQRGTVTISGGQVDIYAACDGISAAYNVEISEEETCIVNVYTASYSEQSDAASVASEKYLIVPTSLYSSAYDYYAYLYNDDDSTGAWVPCTYETMVYSGRTASYYGLVYQTSGSYRNILFQTVAAGTTPDGTNFSASTTGDTINSAMNGYLITGISGDTISGDWVTLSSGSDRNSNKTTYSSKGIKAANQILVSGGTVTVFSMDDGFHANAGDTLENGETGVGSITVSGGSITVTSADDGMHADGELTILGGSVNIVDSHEGLEGNVITVSGGTVYVYADDDGLNACAGSVTPLIQITGGYVDVTTPSGDTDAIDSNGNFTMSGGTVLVKGGASSGGMAGSVDVDGTVTVTGGTIVALGGICEIPSGSSVNTYVSSGTSFTAGDYSLVDANGNSIFAFTLTSTYSSCWIASDAFVLNGSYALVQNGTTVLSWTQSSSTEGSYSNYGGFGGGWGNPGGMGGGRGGRR